MNLDFSLIQRIIHGSAEDCLGLSFKEIQRLVISLERQKEELRKELKEVKDQLALAEGKNQIAGLQQRTCCSICSKTAFREGKNKQDQNLANSKNYIKKRDSLKC